MASCSNPWPYTELWFEFLGQEQGSNSVSNLFRCLNCEPLKDGSPKILRANSRSVSNLKCHLEKKHCALVGDFQVAAKTSQALRAKRKLQTYLIDEDDFDDRFEGQAVHRRKVDLAITNLVTEEMLPFSIVESPAFRDLIHTLRPCQPVLGRKALVSAISNELQSVDGHLKDKLSKLKYLATTADLWSCRHKSYMGVTCHWIDEDSLQRKSAVLACRRIEGSHTYDSIGRILAGIHCEYAIQNKVVSTTTDNASNFAKAFRIFHDENLMVCQGTESQDIDSSDEEDRDELEFEELEEIFREEEEGASSQIMEPFALPPHNRCACHTLSLAATVDVEKAVANVICLKRLYRSTFAKATALFNKQERSTLAADIILKNIGKRLKTPVKTRWNSLYESFFRLWEIISTKSAELNVVLDSLKIVRFSPDEITFIKSYIDALKPVVQALDILQGEHGAFMGVFLPTLHACLLRLEKVLQDETNVCHVVVKSLKNSIRRRFDSALGSEELKVAAALHPSFKLVWVDSVESRNKLKSLVVTKLVQQVVTNGKFMTGDCHQENDEDSIFNCFSSTNHMEDVVARECDQQVGIFFMTAPPCSIKLSKIEPSEFPSSDFKELFLKTNTALPSSAAVERIFSTGKDILKPKRSSLTDSNFEKLLLLKYNKKFDL